MTAFLNGLREKHAHDRAVLVVGHANTIPDLLAHLDAAPDCYSRLGIAKASSGMEVQGYEGVWSAQIAIQ